jgi:hypothetical protein
MANLNPQLLGLLAGAVNNPRGAAMQIINQNYQNNPMAQQLLQMGMSNDINGLKQMAQQVLGQQGLDINTAFNSLMGSIGRR